MSTPRPVSFACTATIAATPEALLAEILDLSRWPEFTGWGPLPGIASARFRARRAGEVGTEIAVTNVDGSTHVERITRWSPTDGAELTMSDFSRPLSRLATHFVETWSFAAIGGETRVTRGFVLHPTGQFARGALVVIGAMLERAVARHLSRMALTTSAGAPSPT